MIAKIQAISYYLPETEISNEKLAAEFPEWSVAKIAGKVGITKRYIADENEFSSDLAFKSIINLFKEYNTNPNEIDFLLLCTQSPDYFLPTTACILQERLNLRTDIGALDFNLGCSGFVYGLSISKGLIETNQARKVLLVTAETYSKFIHKKDKGNRTIFGDAAAATLISADKGMAGIENFIFGTDGKGTENLIVKRGALRYPQKEKDCSFISEGKNENYLYMNGSEIFVFTLTAVPKLINSILAKAKMAINDIDLFVFHQANRYMLETLRKKINIPEEKFYYFMENCGNTVSSTIPICLAEAIKEGRIKNGTKILLAGFGVGYSWSGCIVHF